MTTHQEPVRVLIVDDNASNRALMTAVIESEGYEAVLAGDGEQALDVLAREPIDLVLLDVMMPGTNGIEVTRVVKSNPDLRDIPTIIITSGDDDATRIAALEAGAEEFLSRPIRRLELAKRARNLIRLKRLNDAMQRHAIQLEELVRQRTQEVAAAGQKLESVLDALPLVLFTGRLTAGATLPEFDWVSESAAAVTGLAAQTWLSGQWVDFVDDEAQILADCERLAQTGEVDTRVSLPAIGRTFLFRANTTDGNRIFAVALDVTENEQLEQALQQTQRLEALGELAGGVAHDFNNLLMIITSFTSFACRSLEDDHPAQSELTEVLEASEKAAALTRQLLLFANHQPTSRCIVDVGSSVESVARLLRRTLGENIELEIFVGDSPTTVFADPTQIDQLLMNLAVNARDAMPRGGKLAIAVEIVDVRRHARLEPGHYVRLVVSDTGAGMPPNVAERVFEPFFTTKGPKGGTGLGLATVYGIVQSFDGSIDLDTAEGAGTTFRVCLPMVDEHATSTKPESSMRLHGDECILVVEDQAALRHIARRTLNEWGYDVLVARDPVEAKHLFERNRRDIDLLLTDIILPNGHGEDFADWVEAQGTDVEILLTSGYLGRRVDEQELRFPILWKPYTPLHLVRRVRLLLDGEDDRAQ